MATPTRETAAKEQDQRQADNEERIGSAEGLPQRISWIDVARGVTETLVRVFATSVPHDQSALTSDGMETSACLV